MTEASDRPWRALPTTPVVDSKGSNVIVCRCGNENGLPDKYSMDRWMADAALIVRAVNAHDALVEALETALVVLDQGARIDSEQAHHLRLTFTAALALAKEPAP